MTPPPPLGSLPEDASGFWSELRSGLTHPAPVAVIVALLAPLIFFVAGLVLITPDAMARGACQLFCSDGGDDYFDVSVRAFRVTQSWLTVSLLKP